MQSSVATKIFAIAVVVIVAMAVVSGINLLSAANVEKGIQRITAGYLEIYGASVRVNVYSTEAAYRTRQYIADKALGLTHAGTDRAATITRLKALDSQVLGSLAEARRITALELANPDQLVDRVTLARIDERLAHLATEEHLHLARQVKLIDALDQGQTAEFQEAYDDLIKWRAEYDSYIDATRKMVFNAAKDAGKEVTHHQARATTFSVATLALAGLLGLAMALILSRQLVRPLRELLAGIRAIASGRLEVEVPVKTKDEIGRLTEAFNEMTQELRIGVRARELFGSYVDSRVARQLIEAPLALGEEGERRSMTVMFCDLQGFTALSEQMTPKGLVSIMNRHFTLMSEVIRENNGVIDKFIGDALMAYWGPPFVAETVQGTLAVASGISQQDRMRQLHDELPDLLSMKHALPSLKLRIGIATGEVLVGSIGSDLMRNFTVMGDAVNLAARLEGVNKLYGTGTLICEDTADHVGDGVVLREIDSLIVIGQSHAVRIFEVLGRKGEVSAAQVSACDAYGRGLTGYRTQAWDAARAAFEEVLSLTPGDGPAQLFLTRIEKLRREPPAGEWNGVWVMETK